jgi:cell division protein FtsQ
MTLTGEDVRTGTGGEQRGDGRRPRRRLILAVTIPLLVLVLIVGAIWAVGFSSLLAVTTVQIQGVKAGGTNSLTEKTVEEVANVPSGVPLARLDVTAVQQRVAGIRQLESARVTRQWPHTVRVSVTERTAVFALKQNGSYLLVDRNGVGYQTVSSVTALPLVSAGGTKTQLLQALGTVVAALPPSLQKRVSTIKAPTRDSIQLKLKNGDVVFWGSEEQSDLKAQVTVDLLKRKGTHYDVSAPGNPAVR